jgi:hypothetical protein
MVRQGRAEPSGDTPAGVYLNPMRFMANWSVVWYPVRLSEGKVGNREMVRRGRKERSFRAGRTSVSVRSAETSICSGAGDEGPPEIADALRFREGGWSVDS